MVGLVLAAACVGAAPGSPGAQLPPGTTVVATGVEHTADLAVDEASGTVFLSGSDGRVAVFDRDGLRRGTLPPGVFSSNGAGGYALGAGIIVVLSSTGLQRLDPTDLSLSTVYALPPGWSADGAVDYVGNSAFLFTASADESPRRLYQYNASNGATSFQEIPPGTLLRTGLRPASADGRYLVTRGGEMWERTAFFPTHISLGDRTQQPWGDRQVAAIVGGGIVRELSVPEAQPSGGQYQADGSITAIAADATASVMVATGSKAGGGSWLWFFRRGDSQPQRAVELSGASSAEHVATTTTRTYVTARTGTTASLYIIDVPPPSPLGNTGEYHPLSPFRLLDTRSGIGRGGVAAALGPAEALPVQTSGIGPLPAGGISAVVVNLTVTEPSTDTYVTLFPTAQSVPFASNINVAGGVTRANLAVVRVAADGTISVFNAAGRTHVVLDVQGYFSSADGPDGARFRPIAPTRVLDGRFVASGSMGPGEFGQVILFNICDGPGVVLNVTVVSPSEDTYVTVFPGDAPLPFASNINAPKHSVVPNLVFARTGNGSFVRFFNAAGQTRIVVDALGCFDNSAPPDSGRFFPLRRPIRAFDTRLGFGPLGPRRILASRLGGDAPSQSPVPAPQRGGAAVLMNLTVTGPTEDSYIVAYPSDLGGDPPPVSNVNVEAGGTVANLAVTPLGSDGRVLIGNAEGDVHIIADLSGWFSNGADAAPWTGA